MSAWRSLLKYRITGWILSKERFIICTQERIFKIDCSNYSFSLSDFALCYWILRTIFFWRQLYSCENKAKLSLTIIKISVQTFLKINKYIQSAAIQNYLISRYWKTCLIRYFPIMCNGSKIISMIYLFVGAIFE